MRKTMCALLATLALLGAPAWADPADTDGADETLLLQDPTVSKDHVAFVYAQDLWIVARAGGTARRLTSDEGRESSPCFSPDGSLIAFTGEYEGNADVYVISVDGGTPKRLTWHPEGDYARCWHPDGKHVLFASGREAGAPLVEFFLASLDGGMPTKMAIPRGYHASYNDAADRLAYTALPDAFRTWKRYRGGRLPEVWVYDPKSHDVEVVPHERASDTFPCFLGKDVYFASDRAGPDGVVQMNMWRYTPGSGKAPERITKFTDYGIRNMSGGAGAIAFTVAGAIRLYEPATKTFKRLKIQVRTDGLGRQPRWQAVRGFVRGASIAPNGKRAVFEARGEIITLPKDNGAPRNLTGTPGAHERSPAWSPDGETIAWFSDADGEYELVVRDRLGRDEPKRFKLDGAGFYNDPTWSPDGKRILFNDKSNRLAYLTLEDGQVTEVSVSKGTLGQFRPAGAWSPDSKWIAFETLDAETSYGGVSLYEVESSVTTPLTDGFGAAASPAFSRDGKYLFFQASVNEGPRRFGLDLSSSAARDGSSNLYVVVLEKDGEHPLGPRSDEAVDEKKPTPRKRGKDDDAKKADDKADDKDDKKDDKKDDGEKQDEDGEAKKDDAKKEEAKKDESGGAKKPAIDLEGLSQRILALPVPAGNYYGLVCTQSKLLYLDREERRRGTLKSFDFKSRKPADLIAGASAVDVSADGKWILARVGANWQIANETGKGGTGLDIDRIKVRVDPAVEWPQILKECWRLQRDFFYDPNMHGVDWPAMWERWSRFLPHVQHRADLNVLMMEMIGELCCGHEYVSGGDYPNADGGIDTGLLGADLVVENGRHRVARIYGGQNWNPGLRAPLTEPGVDVEVGDYLISVNGRDLKGAENLFEAFQQTAGEPVELTVAKTPDGTDARTSTVVPLGNDGRLRQLAWIEANRKRVDELSGGRLAYVYMPNTGGAGLASFDRDFYSQLGKQGLILDERFNGGGKVADYIVDVLSRDVICYWMNREGWLARTPFGTLEGPKVMLINESAGSGGDAMPWMFRKLKIGTLVGTTTWGGLVGISGYPPLMDGGNVTAASFGIMDTDGNWVVENVGVPPDVEVVQWPKEVAAGHDPQLEKAVAIALEQLEKNPPPVRPGYTPPTKR